MKTLTKTQIILFALTISLILLSIIPFVRTMSGKPILPGDTPYYHLRISEYIKENKIPSKDPLVERPYLLQPYHLILALTNPFVGSLLFPLLSGFLSILLFYLILEKLKIKPFQISLILLILILSPLFIFLFSTSNQFSLILLLMLAGFYFFIKGKNYFILSFILLSLIPFFGFLPSMVSIFFILIYTLNNKSRLKHFFAVLFSNIIIFLAYQLPFIINYGLPQRTKFISSNFLTNISADLGGNIGFGIFNLVLILVGLYTVWRLKKQITAYLLLLFFILLSIYIPQITIYLLFPMAIFAGYGFESLIKMRWKIDLIKTLTVILIICGLLFSTLSYINRTANSLPDKEIMQSLLWLKENSATTDIVFTYYTKGAWIEAISQRQVITDSQINYIKDLNTKFNDSDTLLYSRNLKKTKELLDKYNIRYIWIDSKMKQGQVWTKEEQGLLFLLRNQENFKKVYSTDNVEIWEVLNNKITLS